MKLILGGGASAALCWQLVLGRFIDHQGYMHEVIKLRHDFLHALVISTVKTA